MPTSLSNVAAIASGTNFHLALRSNSTVVAWGLNNFGQTNVPAGLSNVVAIAAGGFHALAVRANGTVVSWGANGSGKTNVPAGLSNAMAVAAGWTHIKGFLVLTTLGRFATPTCAWPGNYEWNIPERFIMC